MRWWENLVTTEKHKCKAEDLICETAHCCMGSGTLLVCKVCKKEWDYDVEEEE